MIRYLLLSVRFLGDSFHGLTDNGEKPEWPPSPFRLFQALIAGNAHGTGLTDPIRTALMWMESLEPPEIIAPQASQGRVLLTYVPNNVSDSHANSRTPKFFHPSVLGEDRLVQYAWQFDASRPHASDCAEIMTAAVRHLNAFGWGIDLAVGHGEIVENLPSAPASRVRYRPAINSMGGTVTLRVPRPQSLLSLERCYADFLRRYESQGITKLESAGAIYEPRIYVAEATRPFVGFRLVNADGDTVALPHRFIKLLVAMVRALTNQPQVVAVLGQEALDRDVKGHPMESSPHRVSILPLPTIREGPTDGQVRRIMLAQPYESDGKLCEQLGRMFDGLELTPINGEHGLPRMYLERIVGRDTVFPLYNCVSRAWASVTPVLLPGYDNRKQHRGDHGKRMSRAKQLAQKAIAQSGITLDGELELSRTPYWAGSLHANEYLPREKLAHYPRWHLKVVFNDPIAGPMVIGAGRHCGFGIMAGCS